MSKKDNSKTTYIMSCVTSYLLLSLTTYIKGIGLFKNYFSMSKNNIFIIPLFSMLIGILFAIIFSIASIHKMFSKICTKLFYKTFSRSIWDEVADMKNGANFYLYLRGKNYYLYGHFKFIEENVDDPFIVLSGTYKLDLETNEEINHLDGNKYSMVKMSEIEYIEVE